MTEKAYRQVIEYIRKGICNHTFSLGERLPSEREMSEQLGVSRNSVREALRVLDIMGVVHTHQGAGNFISDDFGKNLVETMSMMYALNCLDNRQVCEFRHALELRAFYLAAERITKEEIEQMKQYLYQIENSASDEQMAQGDRMFHYALVQASQSWLMIKNIEALNEVIDIFIRDIRHVILKNPEGGKRLQDSHWKIVEALEKKDMEMGSNALNSHFAYIKAQI